jgi:hypothetical protein
MIEIERLAGDLYRIGAVRFEIFVLKDGRIRRSTSTCVADCATVLRRVAQALVSRAAGLQFECLPVFRTPVFPLRWRCRWRVDGHWCIHARKKGTVHGGWSRAFSSRETEPW